MARKEQAQSNSNASVQEWKRTLLSAGLIVLLGLIAYANSFPGVFLFDENKEIVENEAIRTLSDPLRILFATQRPLVNLSLAVNYAFGGLRTGGYHFFNLGIHLAAALTLFGLTRRIVKALTGKPLPDGSTTWLAFVIAAIWVAHPLNTQAVTYVIQRAESMMAMFYLLTLYCIWRGAEAQNASPTRDGTRWYVAAVVACALGMASKPVMVTAPVVALLFDRAFIAGSFAESVRRRWKLHLGLAATWSVLAALGVLQTTFGTAPREGATVGFAFGGISWLEYALTQLWAICTYLRLSIIPYPQCFDYGWPIVRDPATLVICGLVILGMLLTSAYGLWRNRWWGFVGAMFFLVLAPTSSIIPIRDTIFEHRMYLPLACVVAVIVIAVHAWMHERAAQRKSLVAGVLVMAVLAFTGLTMARNRLYHDEVRMWEEVLRRRPDNARAYDALGSLHDFANRKEKAIELYQKSLALRPDYVNSRFNLATALVAVGKVDAGLAEYQKVLEQDPAHPVVRLSMGETLLKTGDARGLALIQEAVQKTPGDATAQFILGNALMMTRDLAGAESAYRESARLRPTYAEAYYGLGNALMQMNRLEEAVTAFRESLRLESDRPSTWNNLGNTLARLERWPDAEEALRGALRLDPNHINARFALAGVLKRTGRASEAAVEYQHIMRLNPGHTPARQALEALGQ